MSGTVDRRTTVPVLTVVAAVIDEHGRLLVTRRPQGVHLAGLWEFPGGKTASGEAHDDALKREIREELDVEADVHELVYTTTHAYPERSVQLFFYRCTLSGTPQPALGQEMRWVRPEELERLEFPPADAELVQRLAARADTTASSGPALE